MKFDDMETLAEDFDIPYVKPPSRKPKGQARKGWRPKGGPIAQEVWRSQREYILLHGERGSCKTNIAINKVILECYQKPNNLALINVIVRGSATEGGAWEKLNTLNLPEWHDAIGLEFTAPRQDDQKNRYVFLQNQFGGWSRIVLKSIPYGSIIAQRIKGAEPGIILFEELTETDSEQYFTKTIQQLRRPGIEPPQFIATCNPPDDGPEHWVYKKFFIEPLAEKYGDAKSLPMTFEEDEFGVWHVPMTENVFWDDEQKKRYQKKIMIEARTDPTAEDRLIRGLWVARPTGQGLFKEFFNETLHVKGNAISGMGLQPIPGFPIIISYDLGQVHSCATFLQMVPITRTVNGKSVTGMVWIVFDEIDHLAEKILYKRMAWEVIERMRYWRTRRDYPFQAIHVTDESAINQWHPGGEGSYDAWEFEKEYNKEAEVNGEKRIKMIGCPKGAGSVGARVRLLQSKLYQDECFVSAVCKNTRSMLMQLENDDKDPEKPKRSKWVHKFDSVTYGMFKFEMVGGASVFTTGPAAPEIIQCGGG